MQFRDHQEEMDRLVELVPQDLKAQEAMMVKLETQVAQEEK